MTQTVAACTAGVQLIQIMNLDLDLDLDLDRTLDMYKNGLLFTL